MESKSSSALRKDARSDATRPEGAILDVLPVVEQDVRSPDLVCGETEVFHPGVLALVPLEVVVEPALKHKHTHGHSVDSRGQEETAAPATSDTQTVAQTLHFYTVGNGECLQIPHHGESLPSGAKCWW